MRTKLRIIPCFILLLFSFCSKDDNPIIVSASDEEYNKLSIKTDSTIYTWQEDESKDYIYIRGTMSNGSDTVFYSRIGDRFGPLEPELLYIASFSDGYIERYSESDDLWKERELNFILQEGIRVVPIRPSQEYSIFVI